MYISAVRLAKSFHCRHSPPALQFTYMHGRTSIPHISGVCPISSTVSTASSYAIDFHRRIKLGHAQYGAGVTLDGYAGLRPRSCEMKCGDAAIRLYGVRPWKPVSCSDRHAEQTLLGGFGSGENEVTEGGRRGSPPDFDRWIYLFWWDTRGRDIATKSECLVCSISQVSQMCNTLENKDNSQAEILMRLDQ